MNFHRMHTVLAILITMGQVGYQNLQKKQTSNDIFFFFSCIRLFNLIPSRQGLDIDQHRPHCLPGDLKVKVALFGCNEYRALHCIIRGSMQDNFDYEYCYHTLGHTIVYPTATLTLRPRDKQWGLCWSIS